MSFVFTVTDSGTGSVTEADVNVLGNALGYVLNQGSTAHFSPDNFKADAFPLDDALVTFRGTLTGSEAQDFFEHLGTIDEALFSGLFAGFTQIDLPGSTTNNTMLFLQPAASKHRFITGSRRRSRARFECDGGPFSRTLSGRARKILTLRQGGRYRDTPGAGVVGLQHLGDRIIAITLGDDDV